MMAYFKLQQTDLNVWMEVPILQAWEAEHKAYVKLEKFGVPARTDAKKRHRYEELKADWMEWMRCTTEAIG